MKRFSLTFLLCLCAGIAQADLYEARQANGVTSYSDRADSSATRSDASITNPMKTEQLPGVWQATSLDGGKTEFTLRGDGSFVFNQFGTKTRTYMCGSWNGDVDELSLTIKALKQQAEDGSIEQATSAYDDTAKILSAQRDRMIVLINGEKLVFDRAG